MNWIVEFVFPRRLHRIAFLLRLTALNLVPALLFFIEPGRQSGPTVVMEVLLIFYNIFFTILLRLRDIGISGWWLVGLFIPYANTLLAFVLFFRAPQYARQKPAQVSN